jgi:ABC-type uncharacterized transport system auxiliary subunit
MRRQRSHGATSWACAAALTLAAVASGGCLGGTAVQRIYYSLEYPRGEAVRRYDAPKYPITLRIRRFDSAIAYDRQELAYRTNPYEISYYWYRLWAAKPRKMLAKLMESHLRDTNLFQEVVQRLVSDLPAYDLDCEINALEELDSTDEQWFARLALRCSLTEFKSSERVWRFEFDERKRVYQRDPRHVVRALSELLETQMAELVFGLDTTLAKAMGKPAPKALATPGAGPRPEAAVRPAGAAPPGEAGPPRTAPVPEARLKEK